MARYHVPSPLDGCDSPRCMELGSCFFDAPEECPCITSGLRTRSFAPLQSSCATSSGARPHTDLMRSFGRPTGEVVPFGLLLGRLGDGGGEGSKDLTCG